MKKHARQIENFLLTLLLLGGMIGIYLYAGQQERASVAVETEQSVHQTVQTPEVSGDGRLRDAVLSGFSDVGYTLTEKGTDTVLLSDGAGDLSAEVLLSLQGDRVNGLTLRIPLPIKPETKKEPTLIEQALVERYEKDTQTLKAALPDLFDAALHALDPYGEVSATARQYWKSLLMEAAFGDHTASDTGEAIRFRVYEAQEGIDLFLCVMLQIK